MKKVAGLLKRRFENIITYLTHPITNAASESINAKIQWVKYTARLHQSEGRLLRAIDEALARMRKGTYGICEVCKQPISKVRLEAVPWTRLCRACKDSQPAA